jgi:AraC-like DNA-binding protein
MPHSEEKLSCDSSRHDRPDNAVIKASSLQLRVARACSLLVKGDSSITDVAYQAGFNNLSNFNRRFQEITGLTLKTFRKQLRGRGNTVA